MSRLFQAKSEAGVLVVGDVMLDRYVYGETLRISPEAPVPVVRVHQTEERPGGAANVAVNVSAYTVACTLLGLTGDDDYANRLERQLTRANVDCHFVREARMSTITKERVISQHQQLLRLDHEVSRQQPLPKALFDAYEKLLSDHQVVIFSDYAKGCLSSIEKMISLARDNNVCVMIDPKGIDFSRYKGATLLTPNQHEFEAVAGSCDENDQLVEKGQSLCQRLELDSLLITRGENGMTLIQQNGDAVHLSTEAQEVFDVTGAGDTVIATMAVAIASGYRADEAMYFANKAAGLSVAKLGAVSVTSAELNRALGPERHQKIVTVEELIPILQQARATKKRIAFTNGCFDLLHSGHVSYLNQAADLADILIVGVNSDDSVKQLKGEDRPLNRLQDRMQVLAGLAAVDYVVAFNESTPETLINSLQPNVLVKGADYQEDEIVGADFVRLNGGEVHRIPLEPGQSTSALIRAIKSRGTEQ